MRQAVEELKLIAGSARPKLSDIEGLEDALHRKADVQHTHSIGHISQLQATIFFSRLSRCLRTRSHTHHHMLFVVDDKIKDFKISRSQDFKISRFIPLMLILSLILSLPLRRNQDFKTCPSHADSLHEFFSLLLSLSCC